MAAQEIKAIYAAENGIACISGNTRIAPAAMPAAVMGSLSMDAPCTPGGECRRETVGTGILRICKVLSQHAYKDWFIIPCDCRLCNKTERSIRFQHMVGGKGSLPIGSAIFRLTTILPQTERKADRFISTQAPEPFRPGACVCISLLRPALLGRRRGRACAQSGRRR